MRARAFCALLLLFGAVGASPAHAQSWISFRFGGGFSDAQAKMLTDWINDTCRPDEMGNIVGFSYQAAAGVPLSLQVYCRQGGTGKLGKVKAVKIEYDELDFKFSLLKTTQSAAILGFALAKAGNVTDPPVGTVMMVVKE